LESLLHEAVRLCMVSDVPLGAFLSGGIDSSMVVALMQAQGTQLVRTFSIGFHERGYNEAGHAAQVAKHLGTDHTELYVTPADAQAVIPGLPALYDEPFADISQIPTFLVSQLARRRVTVSLSGDGGDEAFGGYNRHIWARQLRRAMSVLPLVLRRRLTRATRDVTAEHWDAAFAWVLPVLPRSLRYQRGGDKLQKLAEILDSRDSGEICRRLTSLWQTPDTVVRDAAEPVCWSYSQMGSPPIDGLTNRMILLDTLGYLPDDILVKLDRATMAVSLEGRTPFLDHRVVEFSWRIPLSLKIRNGRGKWLLRRLLAQYLPEALIERPKMGFGVPIGDWLRGELRSWAEGLLDPHRLEQAGYLEPGPVRAMWREHLSGRRNWQYQLWPVLMFEAWRQHNH
jgi:asparagine synthase (glutamine-hydrolysing)